MTPELEEWYQRNADRVLSRQSSQAETAKLVVTFSAAAAAAIVATGFQVAPITEQDTLAAILLGCSFLLSVSVLFLDRLKEPDRRKLQDRALQLTWTDARLLQELKAATLDAEDANNVFLRWIKGAVMLQLGFAFAAGLVSTLSLLELLR